MINQKGAFGGTLPGKTKQVRHVMRTGAVVETVKKEAKSTRRTRGTVGARRFRRFIRKQFFTSRSRARRNARRKAGRQ